MVRYPAAPIRCPIVGTSAGNSPPLVRIPVLRRQLTTHQGTARRHTQRTITIRRRTSRPRRRHRIHMRRAHNLITSPTHPTSVIFSPLIKNKISGACPTYHLLSFQSAAALSKGWVNQCKLTRNIIPCGGYLLIDLLTGPRSVLMANGWCVLRKLLRPSNEFPRYTLSKRAPSAARPSVLVSDNSGQGRNPVTPSRSSAAVRCLLQLFAHQGV